LISAIIVISLLAGCVTKSVLLPSVGPNPNDRASSTAYGELEVYSASEQRIEGDNPTWIQHTDYSICDSQGKVIKKVWNVIGYYETPPQRVRLAPGSYLIRARASDNLRTQVPVTIQAGLLTTVHLDDVWTVPAGAHREDLAFTPDGHPIGWRFKKSPEKQQPDN